MRLIYVSILFALEIVWCLVYIPFDHKILQLTYQEKVQNMSEFYYSNFFWKFLRFTKSGDLIRSRVLLCLVLMDKSSKRIITIVVVLINSDLKIIWTISHRRWAKDFNYTIHSWAKLRLDNAPNNVVGCIIQKRYYYFWSDFSVLQTISDMEPNKLVRAWIS